MDINGSPSMGSRGARLLWCSIFRGTVKPWLIQMGPQSGKIIKSTYAKHIFLEGWLLLRQRCFGNSWKPLRKLACFDSLNPGSTGAMHNWGHGENTRLIGVAASPDIATGCMPLHAPICSWCSYASDLELKPGVLGHCGPCTPRFVWEHGTVLKKLTLHQSSSSSPWKFPFGRIHSGKLT